MKKVLMALAIGISASAFAGNYASVDVENVKDRDTKEIYSAQYYRFGKNFGGYGLDVQARNAQTKTGTLSQSLEVGLSTGAGPLFVGAGIGHNFGTTSYNYGYVLGGLSKPVGPVTATAGLKYRTGFDSTNPSALLAFGGLAYPLTKGVDGVVGLTRSYKEIKEDAVNVGLRFKY